MFNVATDDCITVNEIAAEAIAVVGIDESSVLIERTGGDRGWRGDVPVVRLNCDKIKALGWSCEDSSRMAIRRSLHAILGELKS